MRIALCGIRKKIDVVFFYGKNAKFYLNTKFADLPHQSRQFTRIAAPSFAQFLHAT
jgi:hypothetical protein